MTNLVDNKIYKEIIGKKLGCYFVSPHLDDAVFSAGGIMSDLKKQGVPVYLINVFTKASPKPYTLSIKKFLKSCCYEDADALYIDRIKEDGLVAKEIGAKVINLNFVDALWRRKKTNLPIPELNYLYPVFRLSIAKGKISKFDNDLKIDIKSELEKVIDKKAVVFCPVGIGKHVDHLIVRNVVKDTFKKVIYWSDYPYVKDNIVDETFVQANNLKKYDYETDNSVKSNLVNLYKSQVKAIFGKETESVVVNEGYFI